MARGGEMDGIGGWRMLIQFIAYSRGSPAWYVPEAPGGLMKGRLPGPTSQVSESVDPGSASLTNSRVMLVLLLQDHTCRTSMRKWENWVSPIFPNFGTNPIGKSYWKTLLFAY